MPSLRQGDWLLHEVKSAGAVLCLCCQWRCTRITPRAMQSPPNSPHSPPHTGPNFMPHPPTPENTLLGVGGVYGMTERGGGIKSCCGGPLKTIPPPLSLKRSSGRNGGRGGGGRIKFLPGTPSSTSECSQNTVQQVVLVKMFMGTIRDENIT